MSEINNVKHFGLREACQKFILHNEFVLRSINSICMLRGIFMIFYSQSENKFINLSRQFPSYFLNNCWIQISSHFLFVLEVKTKKRQFKKKYKSANIQIEYQLSIQISIVNRLWGGNTNTSYVKSNKSCMCHGVTIYVLKFIHLSLRKIKIILT